MPVKEDPESFILPEPSHISFVTRNLEGTVTHLKMCLGLESFTMMQPNYFNKTYHGKPEDFKHRLALSRVGNMVYEVIESQEGKNIYEDFLKEHGEGIHHLGYEISDLARWVEAYRKIHLEPIMTGERTGLKFAYFDTGEMVIELIERTPEGKVV